MSGLRPRPDLQGIRAVAGRRPRIGRRVKLGYGGLGVLIHHRVVLGDDVVLGAGVVIGGKSKVHGVPVVGPRCVISGGAKILGPITIGEECVVGANAVVVRDVPPRSVVAGVPARVLRSDIDIADYHDGIPRAPRPDVSRTEAPAA